MMKSKKSEKLISKNKINIEKVNKLLFFLYILSKSVQFYSYTYLLTHTQHILIN